MKKIGFWFLFVFVVSLTALSYAQESVEILTYYPAPYGVYQNLKATEHVWFGVDVNGNPLSGGTPVLQIGGIIDGPSHSIYAINSTNSETLYSENTGRGAAVSGNAAGPDVANCGVGVVGVSSFNDGVKGTTRSTTNYGVFGQANPNPPDVGKAGVVGLSGGANNIGALTGMGVYGEGPDAGVYGRSSKIGSAGVKGFNINGFGVYGESTYNGMVTGGSKDGSVGVRGVGNWGHGVSGKSINGYGIYGESTNSDAGYFKGRIVAASNGTEDTLGDDATAQLHDIAELIPCSSDVEYGDVVAINPDKDREAIKCNEENKSAAGVISERPQLSFGDRDEARAANPEKNWNYIALAGQVLCKADASYGEIKRGDLLAVSSTPGYAMKAKPIGEINGHPVYPQGCIIGKALEPLKDGKGKILVLVCLM